MEPLFIDLQLFIACIHIYLHPLSKIQSLYFLQKWIVIISSVETDRSEIYMLSLSIG